MSKKIDTQIKRHIKRFENAVRDHAFRGTILTAAEDDPSAAEALSQVDRNYERGKINLTRFITKAICDEPGSQQIPVKGRRL